MNNLNQLRTRCTNILFNTLKKNYSELVQEKIIIPQRIERSPTDILKTLASTIKKDPTAAHYKYHDDPYFIPASQIGKRTFALSKESGRKAAQWIKQQHPDLFQHKVADPPIECFFPKPTYDDKSEVSEEILNQVIDSNFVSDAITIYKLLLAKEIEPSYESKLRLLQLVCFYNCKDPLPEDFIEERWFQQSNTVGYLKNQKTWDDDGFAEELFSSLKETADSRAYCTLFLGRIRYLQVENGWHLYQEILDKGFEINVDCYNALLSISNQMHYDSDKRLKHIQETLIQMNEKKIRPNILTLNATLDSISSLGSLRHARPFAQNLLAEFKQLGIKPSLASYHHLLNLYYKDRNFSSTQAIEAILNEIENQEFTIQDPKDTSFFLTAMNICRFHLQNNELAHRINNLLNFGNNYKFIGNSHNESIYYRHLFIILCNTEPLDKFMEFYNYHVPNIYIPEPGIMEELLKMVEINADPKHIGRLWSDIILFDHINRTNVVQAFLYALSAMPLVPKSQDLINFSTIISNILTKYKKDQEDSFRNNRLSLNGKMISQMMKIVLQIDEFEKAKEIFSIVITNQNEILMNSQIESDVLQLFIEKAVANKDIQIALDCVTLCVDNGYSSNVNDYVKYLKESNCLNSSQMDQLDALIKL